jgi:hypothetical protein
MVKAQGQPAVKAGLAPGRGRAFALGPTPVGV